MGGRRVCSTALDVEIGTRAACEKEQIFLLTLEGVGVILGNDQRTNIRFPQRV